MRVDGQPVGDGRPGPVTRRLQQASLVLLGSGERAFHMSEQLGFDKR